MLTTAEYLQRAHQATVDLLIPEKNAQLPQAIARYESLFNLNLSGLHWVASPLARRTSSALQNWLITRKYDVFFYQTDGSVFYSGAPKSILHIQIPFSNSLHSLGNRLKLNSWNVTNANSAFTKSVIEQHWPIKVDYIHYPYVDVQAIPFSPGDKRRMILSVGRFFDPNHTDLHAKRQDILIQAFRQGCEQLSWHKRNWQLHLVGAVEPGSVHTAFVKRLQREAEGLPVFFHHDLPHAQLGNLYQESQIFWHAAGFGVDQAKNPEKVEHFGMAPLEAMAYGTIPVVTNKGGLREIVENGTSGFLFESLNDLLDQTQHLMHLKSEQRLTYQKAARVKAETFSKERFYRTIDQMLTLE